MRALIDTNIVLDYIAKRDPFLKSAEMIFEACATGKVEGCLAAHTFSNIFYILRKVFSVTERREILLDLCHMFTVEGINQGVIEAAIKNDAFDDFEDALQEECAKSLGVDFIVTRDIKDYGSSDFQIVSPDEFVAAVL
jgi:predicted nucleic acid-binding protein